MTRSQKITINALLCALVLLFVVFPIKIGPLSLAFVPIIAVILSSNILGVKNGMITGLFFGIVSLIGHIIAPSLLSSAFYNPLVSIVPRIFIGLTSYYTTKLLIKIKSPKFFAYAMSGVIGAATNTILVLGTMLLLYHGKAYGNMVMSFSFVGSIVLANGLIEMFICGVVSAPIIFAVKASRNSGLGNV